MSKKRPVAAGYQPLAKKPKGFVKNKTEWSFVQKATPAGKGVGGKLSSLLRIRL